MHIDWVAAATAATAFAAIAVAVVTIRSTASENRRQQLAGMATTAIGYFTGHTQNRSAGIAALRMVQTGLAGLKTDEQELYHAGIRALLYGQLLFVYRYGQNKFEVHEIYNLEAMSDWLCSKEIICGLSEEQIENIVMAMEAYEKEASLKPSKPEVKAPIDSKPEVKVLVDKLPAWKATLKNRGSGPCSSLDRESLLQRFRRVLSGQARPAARPAPSGPPQAD